MLCVRTALVEAVAPQGAFCISSPGPLHLAMQHSQKFNSSQEPRVRNKICVLTCEERQVGRQRAALPVPQLPPCSWHRPGGAQLLMSLETKLRAVESLTKKKKVTKFPTNVPKWDVAPTPNTPDRVWSSQSFPVPSTIQGRNGGLAVVPPLHCLPHTEMAASDWHVFPTCVMDFINSCSTNFDDPAPQTLLETINLTLGALGVLLGEVVQANSCSTCLHCLDYGFFKSCTHFQGRL